MKLRVSFPEPMDDTFFYRGVKIYTLSTVTDTLKFADFYYYTTLTRNDFYSKYSQARN